jgi:hypothetical protein
MLKIFLPLILVFFFLLNSCKKNEPDFSKFDYIIFGHFYGMCSGEECVEIFRLEKDVVLEDTLDLYPNFDNFYNGSYIELSQQKFTEVNDLRCSFPMDLLNESTKVFGTPDAVDQGGIYLGFKYNGTEKFFLFDNFKSNVPVKYHVFIDKINEKIELLK